MFARLSSVLLAFTLVASALGGPADVEIEQCVGGTVQCCNTTQSTQHFSQEVKGFLAMLLSVDVKEVTGSVGVQCTAVNVLSPVGAGQACSQQKVCCSNNNFNGVVALGCSPINASA